MSSNPAFSVFLLEDPDSAPDHALALIAELVFSAEVAGARASRNPFTKVNYWISLLAQSAAEFLFWMGKVYPGSARVSLVLPRSARLFELVLRQS